MSTSRESASLDVFGVGNALVDILALVDDAFVREHDLPKGGMTLVDAAKQGALLHDLERRALEMQAGGSAANTMIAITQSGGSAFYTGKVAGDTRGEFYRQNLRESGVQFDVRPTPDSSHPTGSCLVLTTPDAERTMCTHLGISSHLAPTDIDERRLRGCKCVYLEGYLWDPPQPRQACIQAAQLARRHGVTVALSFSDPFLMDRYRDDFRQLTTDACDVVFCNAEELRRFSGTDDLSEAVADIGRIVQLAFVTDGPQGCLVVRGRAVDQVPGFPVKAVDTVGAGDAFAGGVLYGLTHGYSPLRAARWGNYLASRVVMIQGARLNRTLAAEAAQMLQEE